MKYLPVTILIGALALALHAQTPEPKPAGDPFVKNAGDAANAPKAENSWAQCVITFEAYALDRDEAAALLAAERGSAGRYRRVQEMAKNGKARLQILEALTTKSGQRAVIESVDEVRYPTEFPTPETARGPALPTAWEARNVGDTFEIEPVILPDGQATDINFVPQHVNLAGFRDVPETGNWLATSQPTFNTQKFLTSITVDNNAPHFAGTMTPQSPKGIAEGGAPSEMWLSFVHVSVQGPPPAKARPQGKAPAKPADNGGPLVQLQYNCYSLDRGLAQELLTGSTAMTTPWEKIQALLGEKKARLEHVSTLETKPGQRAVVEEIQEVRYMSEYAPEHRLGIRENTTRTVTNQAGGKKADAKPDAASTTTETIVTTRTDPNSELIPGQAAAFENRNVGVTVEVEPVLDPEGTMVDLNNVVQSVKLVGNLKVAGVAAQYPAQPLFQSAKVTTSLSVPLDLPVLVSTLNPPGADGVNDRVDEGRTFLLFVRATLSEP
ncbi:MAG: hypothetical protein ABJF10_09745 [Chthoniobacter sp.]|uniref:hypothetical protein n=1 Tax=Chthoniobacter sp. TaxID=2510640 RepID=UPI0032ABF4BC